MRPASGRWTETLSSPRVFPWLVALLVVFAILLRLPDAAQSTAVFDGHPDATSYYNQANAYVDTSRPHRPLPHGGSGWPLFLSVVFRAEGVGQVTGIKQYHELSPEAQEALAPLTSEEKQEAIFAASHPDLARGVRVDYAMGAILGGALAGATVLLARFVLSPLQSLLAGFLVAVEPSLVRSAGDAMSEPLFTLILVLAFACVLAARRHPAWLVMAGALAALAYMVRLNGLVLAVALLAFAAFDLSKPLPAKRLAKWLVAGVVCAALVSAPYLSWRAEYLPSPFYMGQNGDVWADEFWGANSFHDASGDHYLRYRTFAEYRENHTAMDALARLWTSATMQVRDFATETSLLLLAGTLAAVWALARGALPWRRHLFALVAVAALILPLAWIYPLVASARYFHPTYPFLAILGVAALGALVRDARWHTGIAGVAVLIGLATLVRDLATLPHSARWVATHAEVGILLGVACAVSMGVALMKLWRPSRG